MTIRRETLTPEQIIAREYADARLLPKYEKVGLWPSEAALVRRFFPPGSSVLDLGCGAGRTTLALDALGYRVVGVDLSPEMIAAARRQAERAGVARVEWRIMDASRLEFPDASFDHALFAYNGYESVMKAADRERVWAEARRVLRPGGVFILAARSGLAFGPRWAGWAWSVAREALKPLGIGNPHLGIGDNYRKGLLTHYITPFAVFRTMRRHGFRLEYYNSERNTAAGRPATVFTHFSRSTSLFYVGRKT